MVITRRLKRGMASLPVTGRGHGVSSGAVTAMLCGAEQDLPKNVYASTVKVLFLWFYKHLHKLLFYPTNIYGVYANKEIEYRNHSFH